MKIFDQILLQIHANFPYRQEGAVKLAETFRPELLPILNHQQEMLATEIEDSTPLNDSPGP